MPPLRRNPEPILQLELAQRGERFELAFVAPNRTVDGALLPVLDVELLISPEPGVLEDVAEPVRLRAAPGERVVHSGALPEPGAPLRFAVRTLAGGKRSALSPEALLVVAPPPQPPSDVSVRPTPEGLSLTWTECVATTPDPPLPVPEQPADAAAPDAAAPAPRPEPPGASAAADPELPAGAPEPPGEPPADALGPASAGRRAEREPGAEPDRDPGASPLAGSAGMPEEPGAVSGVAGPGAAAIAPAPAPAPSTGVRLYRRTAEGEYLDPLLASPLATEAYLDPGVEHGVEYCYRLRTVLRGVPLVEGEGSAEVCATFLDRQPPAAPTGLSLLRRDAAVELAWSPLPDAAERPASLRVYRALDDGALEPLAELPGDATRWTDPDSPADRVVEYALTASDAVGNESPPSPRARSIPR